MFISKRHLKKDRTQNRFRIFITSLSIFLLLIALILFLYIIFLQNNPSFISPLAKQNVSKISTAQNNLDNAQINFISVNTKSDGSISVNLKQGGEVILSSKKDIGSQVASLQLILSRLTIEGKKLKVLDFRFNDPVITF